MIKPSFVWLWDVLLEHEYRHVFMTIAAKPGTKVAVNNDFWGPRCEQFELHGFMTSEPDDSPVVTVRRSYTLTDAAKEVLE